jgi:hypothetical protein
MANEEDDMSEEDALLASQAYMTFVQRFGEYVKEMDPVLWAKAREYAVDFTKIPGVKVELVDNEDEEDVKDDDGTTPEGAD